MLCTKVYRKDVLAFAYDCCKANGGAAGVDGQTFEDIEAYGRERWVDELTQELKSRTYRPLPVRRVYIPKPDGKQRPLGVPAIRNRAAEMAAVLVLEPIFEADLQPEQYAYRSDRSALDAVRHVHKLLALTRKMVRQADKVVERWKKGKLPVIGRRFPGRSAGRPAAAFSPLSAKGNGADERASVGRKPACGGESAEPV